jgi:hypothetical protein
MVLLLLPLLFGLASPAMVAAGTTMIVTGIALDNPHRTTEGPLAPEVNP